MSRFNTGNELGSNDPRDRDDNSKNLDIAVNGDAYVWTDRFGKQRKSWAGIVEDFDGPAQQASQDARRAEDAADLSEGSASQSGAARDQAVAAAEASGDIVFYNTYADVEAALPSLPEGQVVHIWQDETRSNQQARYRVESDVLVFKTYPNRMNSFGSPFFGHSKVLTQADVDLNPMQPNSNYASLGPLTIAPDTTLVIPPDTDYYILAGTTVSQ